MATINLTGADITVDETALLQNFSVQGSGVSTEATDVDDEDIAAALTVNGGGDADALPDVFESRLAALLVGDANSAAPVQVAVSGLSAANATGTDMFTVTGTYTDLAFTDGSGAALDGDASGLFSIDGVPIYLYTDTSNNNIVLGRKGQLNLATPDPTDYIADDSGTIVFAAYLEETATGVKVWSVLRSPLNHDDGNAATLNLPDDAVDLTNKVFVTAVGAIDFLFAGLPSGQNEFLMFKAQDVNIGLIVTGKDPDKVGPNGQDQGDTVNTSQGGGPTSIGTNNQSVDPPKGSAPGEAMIFTFVTDPNPLYTVPDLTHEEATTEAFIDYGALFGATGATIDIAQQTPPKASTAKISAFNTAFEETTGYYEGLLDADDVLAYIATVTIRDASGAIVAGFNAVSVDTTIGSLSVTFQDVDLDPATPGIEARTVIIGGFLSDYSLEYTTSGTHNRVMVENVGGPLGSSPFDIGGFHLPGSSTTTQEIGSLMGFEDDAPSIKAAQAGTVDEDGLTVLSVGIAGGVNDVANEPITATGLLSAMFNTGNDGLKSFGLSNVPADIALIAAYDPISDPTLTTPLVLKSKGANVLYDVNLATNTLTGFVNEGAGGAGLDGGDRTVFTLVLSNTTDLATAAWTFTLYDQFDHPSLDANATHNDTENDILLHLGAVLKITDVDDDFVTGAPGSLAITVDDDTPNDLTPAALTVNNEVDATPGDPSGSAVLGYFGNVGADEDGTVLFVGTNGSILQGDIVGNGIAAPENLLVGGSNVYLFGFGTDTLIATTSSTNADPATNKVFVMTLNPDGAVQANDLYDITIFKAIANLQDVPFGGFTAAPASGNPLTLVVNNIGGSTVDAFFSGWEDVGASTSPSSSSQTTVNVATVGVGVGTGQDFNFDANGAGTADDVTDRIRIEFLEDDGDGVLEAGEATTINRFTYIMNQNNSPADDGDLLVRVYNEAGAEVQITGILINGSTLVGTGGAPVPSNDGTTVTASATGLGYILGGLGGGTGGSTADNDDVTIITTAGYARIDISGIGVDNAKDTFDILLKSLAVPVARDVTFDVQAQLTDEDGDSSAAVDLEVTLVGVV